MSDSNTTIIIIMIASNILTSFLTYCLSSRCTKITTPCITIERDVLTAKEIQELRNKQQEFSTPGSMQERSD